MVTTNAMRLLRAAGVPFDVKEYPVDENDLSGVHIAECLGISPDTMFKTLVARGESKAIYVFCIPAAEELDLKKCASLVKEKKIEMVAVKDLLGLTGYIRGGCSPIGMKKKFPTWVDESAMLHEKITVSSGARGAQLLLDRAQLLQFIQANTAHLTVK